MIEDDSLEPEVVTALNSGRKIEAIKTLRTLRGIDLKEAKDLVDAYEGRHAPRAGGVEKVKEGNSLTRLVVFAVIAVALYYFFLD